MGKRKNKDEVNAGYIYIFVFTDNIIGQILYPIEV